MKWIWTNRRAAEEREARLREDLRLARQHNRALFEVNCEQNRELDTLRASVRTSPRRFAVLFAGKDGEWQAQVCNEIGRNTFAWGKGRDDILPRGYNYGERQWCYMADHLDEHGAGFLRSIRQWPLP